MVTRVCLYLFVYLWLVGGFVGCVFVDRRLVLVFACRRLVLSVLVSPGVRPVRCVAWRWELRNGGGGDPAWWCR